MARLRLVIAVCVTCGLAASQELRPAKDELELPIPISSPVAVQPGTIEPLTTKGKVHRALRNTFSPKAIANRALVAGWGQLWDTPEEWGGDIQGYGQRFGSRMGRLAVRQAVQLSTDIAFGTDPRFDRCECGSFWSRTGHAWKRVVVARKDHGGETFNFSAFAGAYVPPMLTDQWYPDRYNTWNHKLNSGTEFLLMRGATNMLREFWPDVAKKLRLGRFKAGD
jgi:hypothetical protein